MKLHHRTPTDGPEGDASAEPLPRSLTRLSDAKLRRLATRATTPPEQRAGAFRVLQARARAFGLDEEVARLEALRAEFQD